MKFTVQDTTVFLDEETLQINIQTPTASWSTIDATPYFTMHDQMISFLDAKSITHTLHSDTLGTSIRSCFSGFAKSDIQFLTEIKVNASTKEVLFTWIPIKDTGIQEVYWPMAFDFQKEDDQWYSVLPIQQGLLIPNTWKQDVHELPFHGAFCSSSAYLPMYAQIKEEEGYLCINDTPWDSFYQLDHSASDCKTTIQPHWTTSLNRMRYPRTLRMICLSNCDYNTIAHVYRLDAQRRGIVKTLNEKCIQHPSINQLIGSVFLHKGIKTHVQEESRFFDHDNPMRYESLTTFRQRQEEIREWKQAGIKKLYLHLDGWIKHGYDNAHPDILPPCQEAGGWQGLKDLVDEVQRCHYMIGLHDQYRDYYHHSLDYQEENSIHDVLMHRYSHAYWAGGKQDYLCAKQAKSYMERNYQSIFQHGIHPDCTYLDVFTCNEPDECFHPLHPMTKKECLQARNDCFAWMLSNNILTSSEEVNEWSLPYQIFAHYGPYPHMMHSSSQPRIGVPIPFFNLVYHDCVLLPWPMDRCIDGEDFMLYALLNGGCPYLEKDGAYPNTDGVFENEYVSFSKEEKMKRANIVADLHILVAKEKMIKHTFIDGCYHHQKVEFENGIYVEIHLNTNTYTIKKAE